VTANQFRELALSFPETEEQEHVHHPDFRVRGKIFATLGYPNDSFGVLMLTPEAQQEAIARHPDVFEAVTGAWGRRGNTQVRLSLAGTAQLRPWMDLAWHKIAQRPLRRSKNDQP
jgi:YjbR